MLQRFQPPQSEGRLRLMFRNCKQEKDQDLQTFYTDLLTKGTKAFANENIMSMEKNLMDQFIVGLSEEKVRLHLIERRPTLRSVKETLDCAVAYKEAIAYNKNLSNNTTETKDVNTEIAAISRDRGRGRNSYRGANGRGSRRGRDCYTRQRQYGNSRDTEGKPKCFNCGKFGHTARACKTKHFDYRSYERFSSSRKRSSSKERSQSLSPARNRRSGTPYRGRSLKRDSEEENVTYITQQIRSPIEKRTTGKKTTAVVNDVNKQKGNPLFLTGMIENTHTNLFINCGSGISLISDVFYRQISNKKLQQSSAQLQTANQQPLQVLGKTRLNISLHGTSRKEGKFEICFEFHVTEGLSHEVLLGMDFLETYNAIIDIKNKKITIEDNSAAVTVHKLISINQDSLI